MTIMTSNPVENCNKDPDLLWVFGYGSLIWKPPEGFNHVRAESGYIKGFTRKFFQGSTDHRGVPGAPGLVATLIRSQRLRGVGCGDLEQDVCWGVAYGYAGKDSREIVQYLDFREKNGYERTRVDVHTKSGEIIQQALLYVATDDNEEYCGPLTDEQCAGQIARSVGPSGTNAAYLYNLADALRKYDLEDDHVFNVERLVRALNPPVDGSVRVSAFVGDGRCAGDGGWMLQKLWDIREWKEGRVVGLYTEQTGGCPVELLERAGWPSSMDTYTVLLEEDVLGKIGHNEKHIHAKVARFPDGGGLLSVESDDHAYTHYLLTDSCFASLKSNMQIP